MANTRKLTQKAIVLARIKRGWLTPKQAFDDYGITRLADCIYRLRGEGVPVSVKTVEVPTRYGVTARVAAYRVMSRRELVAQA